MTSLAGLTIAITGSRRASELAHVVISFGGQPYLAPTVGIEARQDITEEAEFFINKVPTMILLSAETAKPLRTTENGFTRCGNSAIRQPH